MVFDEQKYRYRAGRSFAVPAQVAGAELERLGVNDKENPATPRDVVDAARSPRSPLHLAFEWDDAAAAERHRLDQARRLMSSIVVVQVGEHGRESTPRQAFVSIGTPGRSGQAGYVSVSVAMNDDDLRARVLRDALAQLEAWRTRFAHLEELSAILPSLDKAIAKTRRKLAPKPTHAGQRP